MPKLIITCGVSGSGKSTYAAELVKQGWVELNRDEWRFKFFCEGKYDWGLYKFSKEKETKVTNHLEELWKLNSGQSSSGFYQRNIIVSNTNLNQKDHTYWKTKAEEAGYEFEVKYFDITLTEALKRDRKRGALSVGQDVLFDQWQKWLEITNARKYEPNERKPKAIVLDIDGTIALVDGRKHFDYSKAVLTDKPRKDVLEMVEAYAKSTNSLIICVSGREDVCREHTIAWLKKHMVDWNMLFMRESGDFRCDTIVKEEIFWKYIASDYNIIAAFDDRPRVVRKWKDIGIPLVISVQKDYRDF